MRAQFIRNAFLLAMFTGLLGGSAWATPWSIDQSQALIHDGFPGESDPYPYVTRAEWGAHPPNAPIARQDPAKIHTLVIHETESLPTGVNSILHIQEFHQKKWADIGYHYIIAFDFHLQKWVVYEGRPIDRVGAHTGTEFVGHGPLVDLNPETLGIVILGNFIWPKSSVQKYRKSPAVVEALEDPAHFPQPARGAIEVLLQLVNHLLHEPVLVDEPGRVHTAKLTGLKHIKAHGAVSFIQLFGNTAQNRSAAADFAINPAHTDCPGHGMVPVVLGLQQRFAKDLGTSPAAVH